MNIIRKAFVLLFVFSTLLTAFACQKQLNNTVTILNVFSFSLLIFYYAKSVKNPLALIFVYLVLLFLAEVTYNLNYPKAISYTLSFINRSILLFLVLKNSRKLDIKTLRIVALYFTIISVIILTFAYSKSILFFLTSIITLVLIFLSSVLFTNLLKTLSRGNFELFLGVTLFIISDATLELTGFNWAYQLFFSTIIYHSSYFLLCQGVIKQQNSLLSKSF